MRAKGKLKSQSGNATPPPRDPDLLDTDQFLSSQDLDELWDWFYSAYVMNVDPELLFVKTINSVCIIPLPNHKSYSMLDNAMLLELPD